MSSLLLSTLIKVALPALTILVILLATRRRGISWRDGLGFRMPGAMAWAGWLGIWIVWMVVGEILTGAFDLDQAKAWPAYPALIVLLRILAIGLVGPFSEEIVMRGMVFHLLQRTKAGPYGAIVLTSILWAAAHYHYGLGTIALICADGLVLGMARYKGRSLWLPIVMHSLGNLFSIYQSLTV